MGQARRPAGHPEAAEGIDLHAGERPTALDEDPAFAGAEVAAEDARAGERAGEERRADADRDALGRKSVGQVDPTRKLARRGSLGQRHEQ